MAERLSNKSNPPISIDPSAYTKNEKRLVFLRARRAGETVKHACHLAGISEPTGWKWNRVLKQEAAQSAARSSVLEKHELGTLLSDLARNEELAPRDRVNAGVAISRIYGYEEPQRFDVLQRTVPPSVSAWLEMRRATASQRSVESGHAPATIESPTPQRLLPQGPQTGSHMSPYRTLGESGSKEGGQPSPGDTPGEPPKSDVDAG